VNITRLRATDLARGIHFALNKKFFTLYFLFQWEWVSGDTHGSRVESQHCPEAAQSHDKGAVQQHEQRSGGYIEGR